MNTQIAPYSTPTPSFWLDKDLSSVGNYTKKIILNSYESLPQSVSPQSNIFQTLADVYDVGRKIYDHPQTFIVSITQQISDDIQITVHQKVKSATLAFFTFPNTSFPFTSEQCFDNAQKVFSLFSSLLHQTKDDLKRMFIDLFNAFAIPISFESGNIPISLNVINACAMTGSALYIHKLAIEFLKEDSDQAKSLTCGAIIGTWISVIMDQSLYIGLLSGAVVALVTDTALVALSRNAMSRVLKKQYREWKIEERAIKIYKISKTIFPYIFYTLGTAYVYAKLRPLTDSLVKDNPPDSEKIYTVQLVITSAMIFSMTTSYLTELAKSVLKPMIRGIASAKQTSRILFWAPRVLATLTVTSLFSIKLKQK